MSAFVVEDKTINDVVSFLHRKASDPSGGYWWKDLCQRELGVDITTREGQIELGQAMFALNVKGVEERYGKDSAKDFRELNYQFVRSIHLTPIQAIKSLQCWHYQCCEGDVPGESMLYAAMGKIAGEIALDVVRELPQWNESKWS